LALSTAGQIGTPAFMAVTIGEGFFYFQNRGADAAKITGWPQAVNSLAPGTAEAAEINRVSTSGKIGQDKTMPPQRGPAVETTTRSLPGK